MMTVDEIMTSSPICLGPDDTLADAQRIMQQHRIRHIPIVDETNKLIGLVTQRDLLANNVSANGDGTLSGIMREKIYTIGPGEEMRGAGHLMQRHKIGSLPVVDGDRLVGIITDTDYVTVALTLLEQLEEMDPLADDETYTDDEDSGL